MNWQYLKTEARKFLVALTAALAILATALLDNSISPTEWIEIAIAFIGALGVHQVSNLDPRA